MYLPTPRSTLFPYTTLFRSRRDLPALPMMSQEAFNLMASPGFLPNSLVSRYVDRKSTRLNSSHMSISYAVFCLKKKKLTSLWPSQDFHDSPAPHASPDHSRR